MICFTPKPPLKMLLPFLGFGSQGGRLKSGQIEFKRQLILRICSTALCMDNGALAARVESAEGFPTYRYD